MSIFNNIRQLSTISMVILSNSKDNYDTATTTATSNQQPATNSPHYPGLPTTGLGATDKLMMVTIYTGSIARLESCLISNGY